MVAAKRGGAAFNERSLAEDTPNQEDQRISLDGSHYPRRAVVSGCICRILLCHWPAKLSRRIGCDARLAHSIGSPIRPAIERFSLELPSGMLEPSEDPVAAIAPEFMEETDYPADTIELIGKNATCASRISNSMYSFFIRTDMRNHSFVEEPGVSVRSVTLAELRSLIMSGEFSDQTHVSVIALAAARAACQLLGTDHAPTAARR